MNDLLKWSRDEVRNEIPAVQEFNKEVDILCKKALNDAEEQLHPLLRGVDVNRLEKRSEFIKAFRSALEKRIARKLAAWQPTVQSIFRFDEIRATNELSWDGRVHLLVKVPRLSDALKTFGKSLDASLLGCLRQLGWSRYQKQGSILDIQQVTVTELRHGVSYGAMFYAVYSLPVKIWPLKR
jgi:hypothetical protein